MTTAEAVEALRALVTADNAYDFTAAVKRGVEIVDRYDDEQRKKEDGA